MPDRQGRDQGVQQGALRAPQDVDVAHLPPPYSKPECKYERHGGADFEQLKVVLALIQEPGTPYTLYILQGGRRVTREQFRVLAEGGMGSAVHPNFFQRDSILFTEQELV
ncbi:MAG TPA: hypothetical protein EYP56_23135, partial [Planctomycetaceae bacterium]|nr:hypothetical protein [Planctomycetaceae bacterium]